MNTNDNQNGFLLASLIISTTLIVAVAVAITSLIINNYTLAKKDVYRLNAQLAADAGADRAVAELNNDSDWIGTAGEVDLHNGDYRSTYEIDILAGTSPSEKIVNVVGRTYAPATDTSPRSTRKYSVDLRSIGSSTGLYSIVTGVGGLFMENSSKIVGGEVFVNGEIVMKNSAQIGLTSNPVEVKSAHQNCPSGGGGSYPQVCSSGQPIDISNPARIYGRVCAKNQTNGSRMSSTGLDASCSGSSASAPAPLPLPDHDRAAQKAAVTNTINGDYKCSSNSAVWTIPANTRITGDFEAEKKCDIYVLGDVWIEGKMIMKTSAEIIVHDSLGSTMPNIMVDDSSGILFENKSSVRSNSSDTGVQLLTYYSKASCSPECASVTGNDLYDSREEVTILLKNSSSAESSILYARWTQAQLDNGGDIGAIVGQTVKLQNSAAVTFGAAISGGGGSSPITWLVDNYRRDY